MGYYFNGRVWANAYAERWLEDHGDTDGSDPDLVKAACVAASNALPDASYIPPPHKHSWSRSFIGEKRCKTCGATAQVKRRVKNGDNINERKW